MIDGWYTLRALAREWELLLAGGRLADAFSTSRDELTLQVETAQGTDAVRVCVRPGRRYAFRQPDPSRPRRNVTSLLATALGRRVVSVSAADRDRIIDLALEDGSRIRAVLFGPRANVLHVGADGRVRSGFRERLTPIGSAGPEPVSAPDPADARSLAARWPRGSMDLPRALSKALPLFDRLLAREAVDRAGTIASDACLAGERDFAAMVDAAASLRLDLESPRPVIYRDGSVPVAFSLIPLSSPPAASAAPFETVDAAVRAYVRATLAHAAFRHELAPLARLLEAAAGRYGSRLEAMLARLAESSRADRWERFGHLLMGLPVTSRPSPGSSELEVADLFEAGSFVRIPIDPDRSPAANAEHYYERARAARRARKEAEARLEDVRHRLAQAQTALRELAAVESLQDLKTFRRRHEDALNRFARERPPAGGSTPFRRFDLGRGYEAWVGRSARENDELTFGLAGKNDWWLHARGVSGSHVVLRNPRRGQRPPAPVLAAAASIAAHFSKASGSEWVPVTVTQCKYVRRPRGGDPGAALVEREEVLLVRPEVPGVS